MNFIIANLDTISIVAAVTCATISATAAFIGIRQANQRRARMGNTYRLTVNIDLTTNEKTTARILAREASNALHHVWHELDDALDEYPFVELPYGYACQGPQPPDKNWGTTYSATLTIEDRSHEHHGS